MPSEMLALDRVFNALANPTRREVLSRLGKGPAPMTELAEPFDMALPSFLQHLEVLEKCGLVSSRKTGRVRTFQLERETMEGAEHWLTSQRKHWQKRLDQLDAFLLASKEKE